MWQKKEEELLIFLPWIPHLGENTLTKQLQEYQSKA